MVVSVPARTKRSGHFENAVHHLKRIFDQRVVRGPYSVANQFKKPRINDFPGWKLHVLSRRLIADSKRPEVRVFDRLRIIDIHWINPNVVLRNISGQSTLCRYCPSFDVGFQKVGIFLEKNGGLRLSSISGEVSGANQGGNGGGERRGRVPAALFPSLLLGRWPV